MPFIGTQPEVGGYSVLDALTASATASYTLQKDSANFSPSSANQLLVSLNGVIQKPGSSFTVSGSTLTFSSALDPADSIDFILAMGEPLLVGTPSDGTVSTAKIASGAVTGAKIENNPTIAGNLTVSGNTAASGTLTSTGLITASAGVAIGGTGAANTLDDYEEGTWTASLHDALTGGNQSSTTSTGYYTKIGDFVSFSFKLTNVSTSGLTGSNQARFSLPFAAAGSDKNSCAIARLLFQNVNWAGSQTQLSSYLGDNEGRFRFYAQGDNTSYNALLVQEISNGNGTFYVQGQYRTA